VLKRLLLLLFLPLPLVAQTKFVNDCTANLKQGAPEEFLNYYNTNKTFLTPEGPIGFHSRTLGRIKFYSRVFMHDGQLYYEGPRYSFIAEKHLENMSEGCKTLPMHQGSS